MSEREDPNPLDPPPPLYYFATDLVFLYVSVMPALYPFSTLLDYPITISLYVHYITRRLSATLLVYVSTFFNENSLLEFFRTKPGLHLHILSFKRRNTPPVDGAVVFFYFPDLQMQRYNCCVLSTRSPFLFVMIKCLYKVMKTIWYWNRI